MQTIDKPWGKEEILAVQDKYMVKRLYMNKGCRCSLQYHEYKIETILVISGTLCITKNSEGDRNMWEDFILNPGDHMTILAGDTHRMTGITDAVYIEASTPELNDVVRIADDHGRACNNESF